IAEARSKNTEEQGAERFYDTGRGCDGNETSENTAGEPECCGLTLVEAFDDNPGECSGSCSNLCCSKRLRCAQATGEAATCVESKPPYPEQPCTDHGQDKIIRTNGKMGVKLSATNEDGGDKATYTCRDVNDSTTGKVDCTGSAQVEQEAIACPHPVCKGIVYENAPQCDEPAIGSERYALGKGASDESGCDDGELGLEHGEHIFRYSTIQDAVVDTAKEKVIGIPSEPSAENVLTECHAVAAYEPQYGHDAHSSKAVHHGAEHILRAHQSAVEHGKAWNHQ